MPPNSMGSHVIKCLSGLKPNSLNLQEFLDAYWGHKRAKRFYCNSSSGKEKPNKNFAFSDHQEKCPTIT